MTSGRLPIGRKVVDLAGEPRPYLSTDERAELMRSCPAPYDRTLDAILALAGRTGRLFAAVDKLADRAKLSRRSVQYHRAWLVDHGYLIPQGGGHKGAIARYLIAKPRDRALPTVPAAWQRIADPDLRAEALRMEL
jgi:DNA-binding transcriptional ArsR family regulator